MMGFHIDDIYLKNFWNEVHGAKDQQATFVFLSAQRRSVSWGDGKDWSFDRVLVCDKRLLLLEGKGEIRDYYYL